MAKKLKKPKKLKKENKEEIRYVWAIIPNTNGQYLIGEHGEVMSLISNKILSKSLGINGYYKVKVKIENKAFKKQTIHRLVAEAFIEKVKGKNQVNHKDGNKLNNHKSNLEWVNASENILHALSINLYKAAKGESHGQTKLNNKDIINIRKSKHSQTVLSKKYNVSKACICNIINLKTWTHIK